MKRKKTNIKYKKERALLSDVLPYELPFTFSNRYFYAFLLDNKVEFRNGNIFWKKDDDALDTTIRLIFGAAANAQIDTKASTVFGRSFQENCFHNLNSNFATIPFGFKIRHKEDEFRELTICHPRSQLQLVDLYHSYKELILYHCSASPFSIRKPTRISKFVFHKDIAHYSSLSGETVGVEEFDKEYENLRSFFVYKDYSHIFRFYESPKFHRCEKKYNKLLKLDITKCFDSVYTHSVSWALYGKEIVKEHVPQSKETFGGKFDKLMQQMNYNETNGIIIGPEFSRIFAELILQSVDRAVCLELQCEPHSHWHKKDYEMFRYVDDYFIFYNDDQVKETIVRVLQLKLKDYKLYLNKSKAVNYEKPIITNISMAKHRIAKLLDEKLTYKIEEVDSSGIEAGDEGAKVPKKTGSIHINSNALITQFKTIIKEAAVEYKDTLNYSLAIIEGKSARIIEDYRSLTKDERSEKQLGQAIRAISDFVFFIYSVSPRANTTIRLCRILVVFTSFLKHKGTNADIKHSVFKLIFDNICLILNKYRNIEHTPVETLYLLIALSELGKDYWLQVDMLCSYFDIKTQGRGQSFRTESHLNYISLVVLLFYMKDKKRYEDLRNSIEATIIEKFRKKRATLLKDAELTLLLFDCLTCPHIKLTTKYEILKVYGIADRVAQDALIRKRRYWFSKWTAFDFGRELDAKQSLEVY